MSVMRADAYEQQPDSTIWECTDIVEINTDDTPVTHQMIERVVRRMKHQLSRRQAMHHKKVRIDVSRLGQTVRSTTWVVSPAYKR